MSGKRRGAPLSTRTPRVLLGAVIGSLAAAALGAAAGGALAQAPETDKSN